MDRETEGLPEALEILKGLFELPAPRLEKCRTLFRLARRAFGPMVELGTFHGNGYIALSLGAGENKTVYTIDDFSPKKGWAGEPYGPADEARFIANCRQAGVEPHYYSDTVEHMAERWLHMPNVGLLFWDIGQNRVQETMPLWEPHVSVGGILAIHDTYSNLFGAVDYMRNLCENNIYKDYQVMPGGVHVATKAHNWG